MAAFQGGDGEEAAELQPGDVVRATRDLGGPLASIPEGTEGEIIDLTSIGGLTGIVYDVRFENGRTETCRPDEVVSAVGVQRPPPDATTT